MRLHPGWILSFGQDLEHLVVRQEEETSEVETFLLQIVVQTLHDLVEETVALSHLLQHSWHRGGVKHLRGEIVETSVIWLKFAVICSNLVVWQPCFVTLRA